MPKLKIIFYIFLALLLVFGITILLIDFFKPKFAGLIVNTVPISSIYINGVFVGKSPYTGTNKAEQINLKLVHDVNGNNLNSYETKINLVPGVKTVVDREFGVSEETSSEDVISFDRTGGKLAGLVIISTPDGSQVLIDGVSVGLTPYNFNSITTGAHKITIKSDGYTERNLNIKTVEGLRLTVFAKLAKDNGQASQEASPSPQAIKAYVIINDTPIGFLRMRTEPGTQGEEIAELKPGDKYPYLDKDEKTGWYKVQYKDPAPGLPNGITGWVSSQYSALSEPSPTP